MPLRILTQDNIPLFGNLLESKNPKGVVLLNPATAAKTDFYRPFAEFLAGNGFHVFLWNYRGFCESKTGSLKGSPYRFSDVGRYDIPAVIEKIKSMFPDLPLFCVGHSVGGQQIGLAYNFEKLDALIAVAASGGHFPYMPLGYRIQANFFFRFFGPVSSLFFKYVPASRFGFMEDLPSGFVREWGDWCKEKEYFFSPKYYGKTIPAGAYRNFTMPIHVFVADDDEICTERNVESFWKNVASKGGISFTRYKASEFPSKKVGHFGYFKKANQRIWDDLLRTLNEAAEAR